ASATCASTRRRTARGAARPSSTSRPRSSCCSRCSCAGPVKSCRGCSSSTRPGTSPSRATPTWSMFTSATCGRRSTGRSTGNRSRPCAGSATGSATIREMSRLPIRIRLTLPFALAMALVLAALGTYVYLRVGSTLLNSTDQGLLAQATEATLRMDRGRPPLDLDAANGARFAQVLDSSGAVVVSQPAGLPPLLSAADARRVASGGSLRTKRSIGAEDDRFRLLAVPDTAGGSRRALVVASPLDARSESLERLRKELLVASPLALLLATLAGYALAGAA